MGWSSSDLPVQSISDLLAAVQTEVTERLYPTKI